MEEIRKTIRFSKEEVYYVMNNIDLIDNYHYGYDKSSFSGRLRSMIKRYKWQEERITDLVRQNQELSDKCARLSDNGYPKVNNQ